MDQINGKWYDLIKSVMMAINSKELIEIQWAMIKNG